MRAIIVSGGNIEDDFALDFLRKNPYDYLVAADRGVEFCFRAGIVPDAVIGDFDSAGSGFPEHCGQLGVPVHRLAPEKDDSDTQSAFFLARDAGADEAVILGGTGTRLDHVWANVQLLALGERLGVSMCMADRHNLITVRSEGFSLERGSRFGRYVSLFSLGDEVTDLTLTGFKYPLSAFRLTNTSAGLTVSNEIASERAEVRFSSGTLLVIQSRD